MTAQSRRVLTDALSWSAEVEDRLRAYERGDMEAFVADDVFLRIQHPPPNEARISSYRYP